MPDSETDGSRTLPNCPRSTQNWGASLPDFAELVEQLPKSRDALIVALLGLGRSLSRRGANSTDRDELYSIALLVITEAVDALPAGSTYADLEARIVLAFKNASIEYKVNRQVIRIPASTARSRKHYKLPPLALPEVSDIDYHNPSRLNIGLEEVDEADMVETICETDQEREVVRLRSEGYLDREVGAKLGLTQQAVSALRKTLQTRYNYVRRREIP